jgi:hypothetical protein
MKSTSVLAIAALLLATACSKKEEPRPSETNITSAPVDRVDRDKDLNGPVETTGGTMTTGSSNDPGNVQGGGADLGTTESSLGAGLSASKHDAGVNRSDVPMTSPDATVQTPSGRSKSKNKSTTLGDGTSGQYTGGKGTYGGKATEGTGPKSDESGTKSRVHE